MLVEVVMRPDLFKSRKCIHVSLKKEIHNGLREKLFRLGLSMQEVINELALLIVLDDRRMKKILDEYTTKKAKEEIARLMSDEPKKKPIDKLNELDQDTLYDLIEQKKLDEDD